jgi:hypothetical protein
MVIVTRIGAVLQLWSVQVKGCCYMKCQFVYVAPEVARGNKEAAAVTRYASSRGCSRKVTSPHIQH